MTRKATQLAERVAAATSRRGFLKRISRFAGGLAAGMAGLLAARSARAGKPVKMKWCCGYLGHEGFVYRCVGGPKCPSQWGGKILYQQFQVWDCADCY